MTGIKIFATPSPVGTSASNDTPEQTHNCSDLPWWLLGIPAVLIAMILLVAALAVFMVTRLSDPSDSYEGGVPAVDEIQASETSRPEPAFSR